ncbi:MAG: histidine kinase dimerization/phospho-acceptor domain-containing protein [Cyclobacteriaceae bacterium]
MRGITSCSQKAKELFLNISHEIRTPINGIAGLASLLSDSHSVNEQSAYLHAIQSAADNLKVIIIIFSYLALIELVLKNRADWLQLK